MKHLFLLLLLFISFSCTENEQLAPKAETGKIWKKEVSASNGRVAYTETHVTGTVTLTGTHDLIVPHNGANLTLADGVMWSTFNWDSYDSNGTGVNITVPSGAWVLSTNVNSIQKGVNFHLYGTMTNLNQPFYIRAGNFKVYAGGKHYITYLHLYPEGNYYAYDNSYVSVTVDLTQVGFSTWPNNNNGKIHVESCAAYVYTQNLNAWGGAPFVFGAGKISCENVSVGIGALTGSSTVKICATNPISYINGGTFGPGQQTCTCVVP